MSNCINHGIPKYSDLKGSEHKKAKFLQKCWPDFYEILQQKYPGDLVPVQLYMYYNGIEEHPRCKCGNLLEYRSPKLGFRKFCSIKCATNDAETQVKSKQTQEERYGGIGFASKKLLKKQRATMQERYGVDNAMHSEEFKERLEQTNIERYGCKHATQNEHVKKKIHDTHEERYGGYGLASPIIMKKAKKTQEKRYGGFGLGADHMKEQSKKTMQELYGVEYASHSKELQQKSKISRITSIKKKYPIIKDIYWQNGAKIYECHCPHPDSCNKCVGRFLIYNEQFYRRIQDGTELCTVLLPYQHPHQSNTSVEVFIKMLLDKYNIEYVQNDRTQIAPKELDFYIPSKRIAIECNGTRWHSTEFKDDTYHMDKWKECASHGIQLLSIWEDWIINSPKIVESILVSKLGILDTKIGARQCIIKTVPFQDASDFLQKNHIQGKCVSTVSYGLYLGDELISVMSFGKKRVAQGNKIPSWELIRFCNKHGYSVRGAASRLLRAFIKDNPGVHEIISFSSNDISNGNLYNTLGFKNEGMNKSYWYIGHDFRRYHRFTFCKSKLVKMGFDKNMTEREIMRTQPYYCIYDSGQTKWVLNLNKT